MGLSIFEEQVGVQRCTSLLSCAPAAACLSLDACDSVLCSADGPQHALQVGELGHGSFGVVVKALDMREKPPREVAIKLLSRGNFVSGLACQATSFT